MGCVDPLTILATSFPHPCIWSHDETIQGKKPFRRSKNFQNSQNKGMKHVKKSYKIALKKRKKSLKMIWKVPKNSEECQKKTFKRVPRGFVSGIDNESIGGQIKMGYGENPPVLFLNGCKQHNTCRQPCISDGRWNQVRGRERSRRDGDDCLVLLLSNQHRQNQSSQPFCWLALCSKQGSCS